MEPYPTSFTAKEIAQMIDISAVRADSTDNRIEELVKAPAEVQPEAPVRETPAPEISAQPAEPEAAVPETPAEAPAADVEERMHGDVMEHRHPGYVYWHPASRIHKKEEN